jgi:hypothetical protein
MGAHLNLTCTLGRDRRNQRATSKWNTPDRKHLLQHHKNNNQFKVLLPFHYNITQANLNWVKLSQPTYGESAEKVGGNWGRILRELIQTWSNLLKFVLFFPNLTSLCHWINWRLSGLSISLLKVLLFCFLVYATVKSHEINLIRKHNGDYVS